jgi:hypothetical protein
MAATAQAMRKLDTATDDIMDLHSDSDFDDGDIDLDLDPAPTAQPEDDDISLKDAGADVALDTQTVTADQDDYMIDHEDYDEGDIQLGDGIHDDHADTDYTATTQEHAPAPLDDDLIDYSDDEDDYQQPNYQQGSPPQAIAQKQEVQEAELAVEGTHQDQAEAQASSSANKDDFGNHSDHAEGEDIDEPQTENLEIHHEREPGAHEEAEYDTDGDTGGITLQDEEAQTDVSEHQQDDSDEQQSLESRAVTINYEGNELWLFKQHDTDDSGDWLIDDTSLIHSSLSDLFQACRASLGEDISSETELGLRFDHFHNMELFEDSTACVAVSLGRLLELYYTLRAQDGDSEPESFYMCLLSRPRFASLLSDVAKHADDGNGYSGLNSAIAAGETHFVDAHSGQSTEHEGTEWDQEEETPEEYDQEENAQQSTEATDEAVPGINPAEHNEQNDAESGVVEEEHFSKAETKHNTATTPAGARQLDQPSPKGTSPVAQASPERSEETAQHDTIAKQTAEQLALDTVDYSDDEDEEPQAQAVTNASPSSATVQGDNPATVETSVPAVESTEHEEEDNTGQDESFGDANDGTYDDFAQNEQYNPGNDAESYQDFVQIYDQEEHSGGFQLNPSDAYPTEADFDGLTNQDYTGYDYQDQDLDQQLQNDFISGGDVDGSGASESANAANEFAGGDDFLDLDNAGVWGTDQGQTIEVSGDNIFPDDEVPAQHEEEEDGVVEQPAVAASSAADPVAASSTDLQESSPQGQKRSRDEAGDLVGDALDPSGMPRIHGPQPHFKAADILLPDTKRPRV